MLLVWELASKLVTLMFNRILVPRLNWPLIRIYDLRFLSWLLMGMCVSLFYWWDHVTDAFDICPRLQYEGYLVVVFPILLEILVKSCSSSRWDSYFHFYVLRVYVCIYWSWELIFVCYYPVHSGYIRKVSLHLVQKYVPHYCSTDSISCSEREKINLVKKILKRDSD